MIQIQQYDHVSMAVPDLDPQIELMQRLFGFRFAGKFESDDGYFGANLEIPGSSTLGWELIAPRGADSYLHRFLHGPTGPGLHHVAIRVQSTAQAAEVIRGERSEPWGYNAPTEEEAHGVVYMHPRSGGHGFLWQLYEGEPWYTAEPFEDGATDTLGVIALNHLAHASYNRDDLAEWYERAFGCRTIWVSPGDGAQSGFRTRVVETPTEQLRFEVIEPSRPDSFVAGFLESRGEAMHHVTFEVGDWSRALAACKTHSVPIFGERSGEQDGARWSEAFIHPRHTGGVLVQFFWQERPDTWI